MFQDEICLKPNLIFLVEAAGSKFAALITLTPSNSVTESMSSNLWNIKNPEFSQEQNFKLPKIIK
jgi:hypothetical protein